MPATVIGSLNWTLGPYRIAREIGRGQFGTVYEAVDARTFGPLLLTWIKPGSAG